MASRAFYEDSLTANVKRLSTVVNRVVTFTMMKNTPKIENHMKMNAPWTDQTTNARNGLAARFGRVNDEHTIVLFHQVPYGIWLEVKFEGRYGIIDPTIREWGPIVMQDLVGLLDRIRPNGG